MKRAFTWITASLSTVVVGITAAATAMFVVANPTEVVNSLAPAVLAGVGTTLGAAVGGLIVLRFKVVRTFVRDLIHNQD